jgi:nucleoside phosphorylase
MGSSTPAASQATVSDAIDELMPDAVVMVGIAFGVDSDKQQIGQILISRQLQPYELQRVGTQRDGGVEIIPRGDRVTASTKLIGRFRAVESTWTGASVKFGLILSGEKLVDNVDFRNQIRRLEPKALGGEMEGAGLYTACSERKTDWIVVKAICDGGDGKKRVKKAARQKEAANQAVGFVLHTIAQGALARSS